jgi:hypothetical protein
MFKDSTTRFRSLRFKLKEMPHLIDEAGEAPRVEAFLGRTHILPVVRHLQD